MFCDEIFCSKELKVFLRDILSSSLWGTLKFSQKFAYVKGIVKDLPCEAKAARLLRKWVFGHRRALLRPDSVDSTGTSIAHWAAQRDNPTPLFKTLKDLGAPLSRNNKVTPHCLTPKKSTTLDHESSFRSQIITLKYIQYNQECPRNNSVTKILEEFI